ncbi:hypothetical protein ABDD95_23190 [Mucilaginibacter sp. PAMB04274]|uniref:tetratricopeptide repeat protein n=1 Tax=Mucilaginibacter sp. PAMB04274 TaxID=3138568 RepID=UPI0031F7179C
MQEDLNPSPESQERAKPVCAQCGSEAILAGHNARLCAECRNMFIKYPVPMWVKLFGAGVVILMLVSLALSPQNFKATIALSRAEKQEKAHNYVSEQQELQQALGIVPNSTEVLAHMLIASFYNGDFDTYGRVLDKLNGKEFDDKELLKEVDDLTAYTADYYPSDSLTKLTKRYPQGVPNAVYEQYIKTNPSDLFAQYSYTSGFFAKENYVKSDSLLRQIISVNPHHMYALFMLSITKRELNQLDSSVHYCNRMLDDNHQSVMALSSKARTLLKQKHLKEGMGMALQADRLDPKFYYNKATMAIAYHLNHNIIERDKLVKQAEKDTVLAGYMSYANELISGKKQHMVNAQTN